MIADEEIIMTWEIRKENREKLIEKLLHMTRKAVQGESDVHFWTED